jgi:hypothetical protein
MVFWLSTLAGGSPAAFLVARLRLVLPVHGEQFASRPE